jgi:thiosulfate dehydrogenase [quinone] large subunit
MATTQALDSTRQETREQERTRVQNMQIAYALFRMTLGMNFLLHGSMRLITGLGAWVATQVPLFAEQPILPTPFVQGFLYVLPFIETAIGTLLLLGLYTRWALIAGALVMIGLVFGTGIRQEWGSVGAQTLYGIYFYLLISRLGDNWLALDNSRAKGS